MSEINFCQVLIQELVGIICLYILLTIELNSQFAHFCTLNLSEFFPAARYNRDKDGWRSL